MDLWGTAPDPIKGCADGDICLEARNLHSWWWSGRLFGLEVDGALGEFRQLLLGLTLFRIKSKRDCWLAFPHRSEELSRWSEIALSGLLVESFRPVLEVDEKIDA